MDRDELEGLDREGLVQRAEIAGIRRARILTRPELIDELLRRDTKLDEAQLKKSRGFFGIARDLLARVVERGLHLPEAADRILWSGTLARAVPYVAPEAMPTLTLAEIYAAQGHKRRAIETLHRVLESEPDHVEARALLSKLEDAAYVAPPPPLAPEPEIDVDAARAADIEQAADTEPEERKEPSVAPTEVFRESDVCVALPIAAGRTFVWWRVSSETAAHAKAIGSRFIVRAVVVVPSWNGPIVSLLDRDVDPLLGEVVLGDLPEGAVVRVAIGLLEGETLTPLSHSPLLEMEGAGDTCRLVRWTLDGLVAESVDDPRSPLARALACADVAAEIKRNDENEKKMMTARPIAP
ncbi:MAG: tetratricopeptide repeat protein [Polyangiaceae bacterium]|nr:tetratricopeptide repeat protein [Polyangiaceae bacterium]